MNIAKFKTRRGFTLIELLVVIAIIGILVGLAAPAVMSAMGSGEKTRDLSNVRQVGSILFQAAVDNAGTYPNKDADGNVASTALGIFQGLVADGRLTSIEVLRAKVPSTVTVDFAGSAFDGNATTLAATDIGWDYVRGLSTTHNGALPLLLSRGVVSDGDKAKLFQANVDAFDPSPYDKGGFVLLSLEQQPRFVEAKGDPAKYEGKIIKAQGFPSGVTILTTP